MSTYIYIVKNDSKKRKYNRTIIVYKLENNKPRYIATNDEISTAAYKGDYAVACQLISDNTGLQMTDCGYHLQDKSINIVELWAGN